LLLLDEPFSGLDIQAQELIGALVERTLSGGGGAILVSHDADRLASTASSVLTLVAGRLEERS
jgi:ABC-type sulfate/molybdate transport systems ATPase subunit